MKNIIIPTDFSDNAYNALYYALQLFKEETCTFFLVNTYTPILYDTESLHSNPVMLEEDIYKTNSLKGLETAEVKIKKMFPNEKHRFVKISSFNFLFDEIKDITEKHSIDLIIMGTQGATGAEEVLFGTQTVDVIKKAKHPVLAIPSGSAFSTPKNILFPTDYGLDFVETKLSIAREIAVSAKANIHFLNVSDGKELTEEQQKSKKTLAREFKDLNEEFHRVENSSVTDAILDFQQEHNIDFLVMINNKYSFFENLFFTPKVNEIGFHVKVPFLVIPSGKYSTKVLPVNLVR